MTTSMRAAAITGPGRVELVEQEVPRGGGDVVLVRILVAPLCTEFKDRRAGAVSDHLGHEAAGVVVDPGGSDRVRAGDRVVVMPQYACGRCRLCQRGEHIHCPDQRDVLAETGSRHGIGTIAEYVLKPDWLLLPVPDDVPLTHAAMACCGFGPSFTAHDRIGTTALDTVVVSGCGPVGLGAVVQGTARGARVVAVEGHPYRAELARKLGASDVLDPAASDVAARVRELTGGWGADGAVETSGAPAAAAAVAAALRVGGHLSVVAWTDEVRLPNLVPLGIDVHGCWHWNHQLQTDRMWTTIRAAGPAIDAMVTHRLPLADVAAAMDVQDTGECGKVLLFPFGEEAAR
ncbi:zinc-dependent alcohol dehydrogenase [Jiangella alkaliphila]|uniref:Threonine dehydrogenase n=1 Tax=Jiangella alkaliphila TaxID=419479 RepID=A0A1H2LW35_9ACTN|nr:zinc-binding dehydrogenase [Jiangella alkaliphila]SDU85149.1 Threonine dehydrogenase [Jiangella alkaliphila]